MDLLLGDPTKAKKVLGWDPSRTPLETLVQVGALPRPDTPQAARVSSTGFQARPGALIPAGQQVHVPISLRLPFCCSTVVGSVTYDRRDPQASESRTRLMLLCLMPAQEMVDADVEMALNPRAYLKY